MVFGMTNLRSLESHFYHFLTEPAARCGSCLAASPSSPCWVSAVTSHRRRLPLLPPPRLAPVELGVRRPLELAAAAPWSSMAARGRCGKADAEVEGGVCGGARRGRPRRGQGRRAGSSGAGAAAAGAAARSEAVHGARRGGAARPVPRRPLTGRRGDLPGAAGVLQPPPSFLRPPCSRPRTGRQGGGARAALAEVCAVAERAAVAGLLEIRPRRERARLACSSSGALLGEGAGPSLPIRRSPLAPVASGYLAGRVVAVSLRLPPPPPPAPSRRAVGPRAPAPLLPPSEVAAAAEAVRGHGGPATP